MRTMPAFLLTIGVYLVFIFPAKAELFFRENKGQVKDQHWKPRSDVLFSYDEGPLHIHLKKDGLHYQLYKVLSWKQNKEHGSKHKVIDSLGIFRVDVQWLNTNKNVQIERGKELPGYENFYNVPDGVAPALFVKRYDKLIYKNIYNGIDLHFFEGKHGGLEYDYVVHPGADYKHIQWKISGASLHINAEKELVLKTPYGEIVEGGLLVLQGDKKIDAEWKLHDNVLSINIIGNYDKTRPLRIDPPVRLWGTYYNGTNLDGLVSCYEDGAGNVYAAGDARANNMATSGAHQTVFAQGNSDALLAKFNTNGQRIWATYYGGAFADNATSVGVDGADNVYLIGETQSASAIATAGTYQSAHGGNTDVFIAKFNSSGVRQWGTYYGGANGDIPKNGTVDAAGNIYVCGNASYTSAAIASAGAHQTSYAGGLGQDCFLAKFNTSGQRVWGTYYGGTQDDRPGGCTVDAQGNVFLCGFTASTSAIATAGAHQTVLNNQGDAFLVKFNSNGVRQWGTYYGGTQEDRGVSCGADGSGNVYLLGRTNSTSLIATTGTHQPNFAGSYDAFIVKFNASGTRQWGTYYGGTGNEEPEFLHANSAGNILITGETGSATLIATATAHQTAIAGGSDGFLALFDANGQRVWGTYYGGTDFEQGQGCNIGGSGFYYLCGLAVSGSGIATTGTYQATLSGSQAGFLAKFEACVPPAAPTANGTTICGGQTATLTATAPSGVTFNWYTTQTGGTPVGSGSTFTTPALNSTTTYYVESVATGCPPSTRTAVTVTVTPAPSAPIANAVTPGVCKDSTATFQVTSAGTTFNWYATNTSTTVLGTGTTFTSPPLQNSTSYFVERIENGCPSPRTQVFVQVITALDPTPANTSVCSGTSATLNSNVSSGTVNWYNSPSSTTPIHTGSTYTTPALTATTTYYVQTFVSGCLSARVPVTVTVVTPPAPPTVNNATICSGQNATLTATAPAGVNFAWFTQSAGGSAIYTGATYTTPALTATTTYYVESQVGNCNSTSRTPVTVTVNPSPTVNAGSNSPLCEGDDLNLTVNATANATYAWSGPNNFSSAQKNPLLTSVSTAAGGTYSVTVTANGCSSSSSVNVLVNPLPTVSANYNSPLCEGSDLNLTVNNTPNATYNWSGPAGFSSAQQNPVRSNIQTAHAGTYSVTVTANGCTASGSVNVVVNSAANLNVSVAANPSVICAGENSTLTASGATSYSWSNGLGSGTTHTVSPPNSTAYSVTATDAATGCTATASVTVTVNPLPNISIAASQTTLCENGNVTLTASGAANYLWSTNETTSAITVSPTATTTYTVTSTDANGCSNTASQTINVLSYTTPQFIFANNLTLCFGNNAPALPNTSLNGIAGTWQPSVINNTQSGTYTFIPDTGQCAAGFVLDITVQQISISAGPDTIVDLATSVQLYANVKGSSNGVFSWLPISNLSCSSCSNPKLFALQSQTYSVSYTDVQTGCIAATDVNIEVNYDPNTVFYIPNVFSPNGDGSNDFFEVYGLKIKETDLQVFNRWGEMVYSEKNQFPKWDGYYKGVLQNPDVYVYHAYITFYNGKTVQNKGSVTLVK